MKLRIVHKLVGMAAICVLAALFFTGSTAAQSASTFRVMTYNIHHAEGLDRKVDLRRIADLIQRKRADLVALQEVDRKTERTGKVDMPAELAALTGMTCVFSNNFGFQGGEYGTAILSRFPVLERHHRLLKMVGTREQRGLLWVHVRVGEQEVVLMNTHLDHRGTDVERLQSLAEIAPVINANSNRPVILCGDFNDTPGKPVYAEASKLLADSWERAGKREGFSIPAPNPNKRIDYIWFSRGSGLTPLKAWVPASTASDHLPVVAEFSLPQPGP